VALRGPDILKYDFITSIQKKTIQKKANHKNTSQESKPKRQKKDALLALDGQVDAETLEVDDDDKHQHGGQQVGQVRQVGAVERLTQSANLVMIRNDSSESFVKTRHHTNLKSHESSQQKNKPCPSE
jgi:hypothetical protein